MVKSRKDCQTNSLMNMQIVKDLHSVDNSAAKTVYDIYLELKLLVKV